MPEPQPRTILITGGNGGLGIAIAQRFLDDPLSSVILGVHANRDAADALASQSNGRCSVLTLDVTKPDQWQSAVNHINASHQRLDVLVNNAGNHDDSLLGTMSDEAWDKVIRTNLDAVAFGCRAVLRTMLSQRFGRICNISSLSALMAPAGQTNYAAAKAGTIALTRALAKETARSGITVNAICPGYIETDAIAGMDADQRRRALAGIPMRRFGKPEEVAHAIHFLACPEASYITGSVLKIDGGIF